ncbi:hypothetical protein EV421DRAFT_1993882 [Armillaria borealis]|uniref:Uncharacterized protein n=1 Tax=Armillaria borealis TaxID=47425 RepID=A0AA39MHP9_9AGAR|nr:hypothetical protein EV421DRAFT_1993882 [Armillaria borealis]
MSSSFYNLADDVYHRISLRSQHSSSLTTEHRHLSSPRSCLLNFADLQTVLHLAHRTRHAHRLASCWLADSPLPLKSETTFFGSPVSQIKFVPGRQHKWVLTASKGIWSILTIWDITLQQKCSEWSPEGAIFTRVQLNADPESEAGVAVSLSERIVLPRLDDNGTLHEISFIDTDLRPVTLSGAVMALDDGISQALVYNWKTDECAYIDDVGDNQHDHCLRVVFTPPTILVLRACSISLYTASPTCIATPSFGQVDGASAPPTSILIRSQSNNPWVSDLS